MNTSSINAKKAPLSSAQNVAQKTSNPLLNLCSGYIAGLISIICVHPVERVKMMRIFGVKDVQNKSMLRSIHAIVKKKGFRGLFRGCPIYCVQQSNNAAIMFYTYERMKQAIVQVKPDLHEFQYRFLSGTFAGMTAATCVYYMSPIKVVMVSDISGRTGSISQIARKIYRK